MTILEVQVTNPVKGVAVVVTVRRLTTVVGTVSVTISDSTSVTVRWLTKVVGTAMVVGTAIVVGTVTKLDWTVEMTIVVGWICILVTVSVTET